MAIANTMGLTTAFNLSGGTFTFTDVNPYVAEGIALTDVEGIVKVFAPDGTYWHQGVYSAPDILPNISLTNTTIPIPTDANGDIQEGAYVITYEITVSGGVQPGTYSKVYNITYCPDLPTLVLNTDVDCLCGIITATDATAYTTTTGTWTINSRTISLRNATAFASPQTTTGAGPQLQVTNNIYLGSWHWALSVDITLSLPGYSCTVTIKKEDDFEVDCGDACEIFCCLKAANNRYTSAVQSQGANSALALQYGVALSRATTLLTLMQTAVDCGKNADATNFLAQIKTILDCNDDCGCGSEPRLLVPLCSPGGGVTYNFIAGTGINITNIAGNVTISLSATNTAILAAVYNTTVSAGGSGAVTVTGPVVTPGTPDIHNYTVDASAALLASLAPLYTCKITITFIGGGVPSPAISNETIYDFSGTLSTPNITYLPAGPFNPNNPVRFRATGYTSGPLGHKVYLRVLSWTYENSNDQNNLYSYGSPVVDVYEFDPATSEFTFTIRDGGSAMAPGLVGGSGAPFTYFGLQATFRSITLEMLIIE